MRKLSPEQKFQAFIFSIFFWVGVGVIPVSIYSIERLDEELLQKTTEDQLKVNLSYINNFIKTNLEIIKGIASSENIVNIATNPGLDMSKIESRLKKAKHIGDAAYVSIFSLDGKEIVSTNKSVSFDLIDGKGWVQSIFEGKKDSHFSVIESSDQVYVGYIAPVVKKGKTVGLFACILRPNFYKILSGLDSQATTGLSISTSSILEVAKFPDNLKGSSEKFRKLSKKIEGRDLTVTSYTDQSELKAVKTELIAAHVAVIAMLLVVAMLVSRLIGSRYIVKPSN
ncbi:cache domain-containing protein, partial [bacterium]|nr:cache domain-containing protein [bacterium]